MTDITYAQVWSDHAVSVGEPGESVAVKVLSGDTVYYGDPNVSSTTNRGSITAGNSVTMTNPVSWLRSASVSFVQITGTVVSLNTFNGKPGATYGIVAAPIQNAGPSNYWQPITIAGHEPVGIDSVTTSAGSGTAPGQITIDYTSLGATKVVSFVVVPDETLSINGFSCGASVGLTSANINLAQTSGVADQVSFNGASWVFARGTATPFAFGSFTSGVLNLTHPTVGGQFGVSLVARSIDGTTRPYQPVIAQTGGVGSTSVNIEFWNQATGVKVTTADTNMKVFVVRSENGWVDARPVDTTAYPSGNLWVFGLFRTN